MQEFQPFGRPSALPDDVTAAHLFGVVAQVKPPSRNRLDTARRPSGTPGAFLSAAVAASGLALAGAPVVGGRQLLDSSPLYFLGTPAPRANFRTSANPMLNGRFREGGRTASGQLQPPRNVFVVEGTGAFHRSCRFTRRSHAACSVGETGFRIRLLNAARCGFDSHHPLESQPSRAGDSRHDRSSRERRRARP